jgi:hypothetical protein
MLCRRGGIDSAHIGAIEVRRAHSVVEIASAEAAAFLERAAAPDPRDPKVKIRLEAPPPDRPSRRAARGE